MRLIDSFEYQKHTGEKNDRQIRVYALSTCAFCEKAMKYLEEKGFTYEYIFMDRIPIESKKAMKGELKEQFGNIPVFPLLVVDGEQHLSGFTEPEWAALLGTA